MGLDGTFTPAMDVSVSVGALAIKTLSGIPNVYGGSVSDVLLLVYASRRMRPAPPPLIPPTSPPLAVIMPFPVIVFAYSLTAPPLPPPPSL